MSHHLAQNLANPLDGFRDQLFELLSQALMSAPKDESALRVVALRCLLSLCSLRDYLPANEVGMVVQYLDEIVLREKIDAGTALKDTAIQGLVEISTTRPNLITDITFPAFMGSAP